MNLTLTNMDEFNLLQLSLLLSLTSVKYLNRLQRERMSYINSVHKYCETNRSHFNESSYLNT